MRGRTPILAAIAALTALSLAAPLAAADTAGKTRLTIKVLGKSRSAGTSATFTLLGASANTDSGTLVFKAVKELAPETTPDGFSFTPVRRTDTLKGKQGTLVIRSTGRQFSVVKEDDFVWIGSWSIVSGTGRYAGLKGGGGIVGIIQAPPRVTTFADYDFSYGYEGMVTGP